MSVLVDKAPGVYVQDLVYAVAELVAAILDVHGRVPLRQVAAVYVRDPAHAVARSSEFTPNCFSLRCNALRSMPTNWAVRLMLPPNRISCACKY